LEEKGEKIEKEKQEIGGRAGEESLGGNASS
jgi:hypothetical protein